MRSAPVFESTLHCPLDPHPNLPLRPPPPHLPSPCTPAPQTAQIHHALLARPTLQTLTPVLLPSPLVHSTAQRRTMQEKTSPDALRAEVRVAVRGRQGLDLATSSLDPMSGSTTSALTPPDHDLHAINQPLTQNLQRGGGLVQGVRRCGKKRAVGAVPSARAASPISHGRRQAIEGVHEPRPPWRMDPRMSPRRTVLWMHHQLASLPKPQRRARVVIIQQVAAEKPNPTIFLKAYELLGVKLEVVHIGDDCRNDLWGAGMHAAMPGFSLWGSEVYSFKEVAERIRIEV